MSEAYPSTARSSINLVYTWQKKLLQTLSIDLQLCVFDLLAVFSNLISCFAIMQA